MVMRQWLAGNPLPWIAICLGMLVWPGATAQAQAPQPAAPAAASERSMAVGLGVGVYDLPQESGFTRKGTPLELFFDWDAETPWMKFRVGYNLTSASLSFDRANKTWENILKTTSLYGAIRYGRPLGEALRWFVLGGMAYMSATLDIAPAGASASDAGPGLMGGAGAIWALGGVELGAQYVVFSRKGRLGGAGIATGSNQVQLLALYRF
jgi:hypothetical protein